MPTLSPRQGHRPGPPPPDDPAATPTGPGHASSQGRWQDLPSYARPGWRQAPEHDAPRSPAPDRATRDDRSSTTAPSQASYCKPGTLGGRIAEERGQPGEAEHIRAGALRQSVAKSGPRAENRRPQPPTSLSQSASSQVRARMLGRVISDRTIGELRSCPVGCGRVMLGMTATGR